MTDDEKRQEKAFLLLECQEAEADFALLAEKARKLQDSIQVVVGLIDSARVDLSVKPQSASKREPIYLIPKVRESLDADSVEKLLNELTAARARVFDLRQRKAMLGLK